MGVQGFIARIVQNPDGLQKLSRDTQNQPLAWAQKGSLFAQGSVFSEQGQLRISHEWMHRKGSAFPQLLQLL